MTPSENLCLLTACAVVTKNKTASHSTCRSVPNANPYVEHQETTRASELHREIQLGFLFVSRGSQLLYGQEY